MLNPQVEHLIVGRMLSGPIVLAISVIPAHREAATKCDDFASGRRMRLVDSNRSMPRERLSVRKAKMRAIPD